MEKQRLLNVYVNNLTMMESVNRIHDMIREKQTSYVVEVNVDVVMKMEKDPYLKKISDEADLTLVDGQPLVWISKMKGNTPIREKISGSDLVPELLDELSRENRSVFILGGLGDTAKKAAKNVKKQRPEAVSIFILPPSMQALHSRLVGRGTETPEAVEKRFGKAKEEISHANEYDYIVVNDSLDTAIADVASIIRAERLRSQKNDTVEELLKEE